jgi:hypothetical protein
MSAPPVVAMALSEGALERLRKGMLREKRLAEGFKEDWVWLASIDNIAGAEVDSSGDRAGGSLDACSSIDVNVREESTPACGLDGEALSISITGDLDGDDETGENHLRAGAIETETVSDGGWLSTRISSGLGGVGGVRFITGSWAVSRIGGSVGVGSIGGCGSSTSRNLLSFMEDEEDTNQGRLLDIDLMLASVPPALAAWEFETGTLAGIGLGCSTGDGATTDVVSSAVSTLVDDSSGSEGDACLTRSFRGTVEEPRFDNDASHERG